MVKMYSNGITIMVRKEDIDFFKRAGYVIVEDKPVEDKPAKAPKGGKKAEEPSPDAPAE